MPVHMISYDLIKTKDYDRVHSAIMGISGEWCRPLNSVWYVKSNYDTVQIRDYMLSHLDADDRLIVSLVGQTAWSATIPKDAADWLVANI
jgi:hypothetical protein